MTTYIWEGQTWIADSAQPDGGLAVIPTTTLTIVLPDAVTSVNYSYVTPPDPSDDVVDFYDVVTDLQFFTISIDKGDGPEYFPFFGAPDVIQVSTLVWDGSEIGRESDMIGLVATPTGTRTEISLFEVGGAAFPILSDVDALTDFFREQLAAEIPVDGALAPGREIAFDILRATTVTEDDFIDMAFTTTGLVEAGAGDDTVRGIDIADTIRGGDGDDRLTGFGGDDLIEGGAGADTLGGGAGNDRLSGEDDADELWTAAGDDLAFGGAGDDTLGGAGGDDTLEGGAGADELWGAVGADSLLGGEGEDTLGGFDGDDTLEGGAGADELWGALGNDLLNGGEGNDTLGGFDGDDDLDGGAGNDELWGALGNDTMTGGAGDDQVGAFDGDDVVGGGAGNDGVFGGRGNDDMTGDAGDDQLFGFTGNDTLNGGTGNDTLYGGTGDDRFVFLAGDDIDEVFGFGLGADLLLLDEGLWTGVRTRADVVADFADVVGLNVEFDFGGGDVVRLMGVSTTVGLDAMIEFV